MDVRAIDNDDTNLCFSCMPNHSICQIWKTIVLAVLASLLALLWEQNTRICAAEISNEFWSTKKKMI